jgi:DNA-binding winged helix-turn-helix (wHTH) protein/tetratricopeptide (TPR) repeat protein
MSEPGPLLLRFGEFRLDERNARLRRGEQVIELQPKAFAVLCALARQPGQLVTKEVLLDAVWGHRHISESVLKTIVSQLRNALADDARAPRYIETASRRGYRFIAPIDAASPASDARAAATPAAAPARSAADDLVGRGAPLQQLRAHWAEATRGRRRIVFVAGEPGIGKSTLIDGFADSLGGARPALAIGQCVEHYGAGEPYMPVLEALNMLCRGETATTMLELLRRVAPSWLVQLPWHLDDGDRQQLQREVTGATQDRMLREAGELLDRFTASTPLLIVLEDLHWSDAATVQLIGYLARRRGPAALMLLGSFRPTEVIVQEHPLAGLRQELRLHRLCHEIDLDPWSEAEVADLLARRLGGAVAPEAFVRALHDHSEGSPLFVTNLLDELRSSGSLRRVDTGWCFPDTTDFGVPDNIAGVVEKQISRLTEPQQRALEAASVAGAEFSDALLARVLDKPTAAVAAALEGARQALAWLDTVGVDRRADGSFGTRYRFRHAMYRHVMYQRVGVADRMRWHRQTAAALADMASPELAAEIAMHFERGGAASLAARPLASLAATALARGATQEALAAARHGLECLAEAGADDAPLRLDLHVIEGVALTRLHVISTPEVGEAFEHAAAMASQVGAIPARARALHGCWWVHFSRGELATARTLARRMLELADQDGDATLELAAHSALGVTLAMIGELQGSRRHLEAVLARDGAIDATLPIGIFVQDPGVEARAYLALVLWWSGEPSAARRHAERAVARATELRHPISQLVALHLAAAVHYFAGEYLPALMLLDRLLDVIRQNDLPNRPGTFSWLHGHCVAALGDVSNGLAEMRAARRSCEELGLRVGLTGYHLHQAEACHDAGLAAEAQASVAEGLALSERTGEACLRSPLLRLHAELAMARGQHDAAAESMQAALDAAVGQGARFHELAAAVGRCRQAGGPDTAMRARLQSLLAGYEGERIAVVEEARALLRFTPA